MGKFELYDAFCCGSREDGSFGNLVTADIDIGESSWPSIAAARGNGWGERGVTGSECSGE